MGSRILRAIAIRTDHDSWDGTSMATPPITFAFRPGVSPERQDDVLAGIGGWAGIAAVGRVMPDATLDALTRICYAYLRCGRCGPSDRVVDQPPRDRIGVGAIRPVHAMKGMTCLKSPSNGMTLKPARSVTAGWSSV
jgi:hypothetical protein